jgi:mannose-6-phosphate isomerase-like protein (cupin superfamily)
MRPTILNGGNISPFTVEKAWGCETTFGVSENVALKKVVLHPNESLSRQVHLFKDEIYAVLTGSGSLELGDHGEIVHLLAEGDAVHLPAGVKHRLIAGREGIIIIEASTPEITDIIRIEDSYNRQVNPNFDARSYRKILGGEAPDL